MESLRYINRKVKSIMSWRSEYRNKKEIAKTKMLEVEKAEAEKLYWLMDSCLEFAKNIEEDVQITSDNPVILEDAKFWILTQVQKIKASWWPQKKSDSTRNFIAFKCIFTLHFGKSIRIFFCRC